MAVKLIFSFDSEDYETPAADDAEKWWAEAMSRHGLTACVCVVGELARALRDRGRADVVAAMARHEIAYHSDRHSAHPTWAEYLDGMGWDEGVARVLREEGRGLADVAEVFGQYPSAWCKPGGSWGPQVAGAMAQMQVPVFCDSQLELGPGRPLWFDNNLLLAYHHSFDHYFTHPHAWRLEQMQADFTERCARHDGGVLVLYTHPCRLFTSRFTDTFEAGRNPPRDQWGPSPLRPAAEIAALQADFDAFLTWVVRQPGIEFTTYRTLYDAWRQPAAPWLGREALLAVCERDAVPDYRQVDGAYLSPAEQFGVVARAMAVLADGGRIPECVAVRRLLGPTATPPEAAPRRVPWPEFAAAARAAEEMCRETRAVPYAVPLGDSAIGPNAYLQAAARVLREASARGTAPAEVEIGPAPEYPAITERDGFRDYRFNGSWSVFAPDFEAPNVVEMIRLQAWTAKPVVMG